MDQCEIGNTAEGATFQELFDEMQSTLYWVRFFARPCCPAPDAAGATQMLEHLKRDVMARDDFSDEQKQALCDVIDERNAWYPSSGLCRK